MSHCSLRLLCGRFVGFYWRTFSLITVALLVSMLIVLLGSSAIAAPTRPVLTAALLEERIASPIQLRGNTLVDLRDLTIDLRENEEDRSTKETPFVEQFYKQLQTALSTQQQKDGRSLGVDFSGSLIQGDFDLTKFSRRIPAYGEAILPALESFKQTLQRLPGQERSLAFNGQRLSRQVYSKRLSRFLLPAADSSRTDTLVFQGPLIFNHAYFNGTLEASNLYFLGSVEAENAVFTQPAQWQSAKFANNVSFRNSQFQQESSFKRVLFARRVRFNQSRFSGASTWKGTTFRGSTSFADTDFQAVTFDSARWQSNADFERARFRGVASFQKSRFEQALFLTDALLEGAVNFRQAQFQRSISLRAAHVLGRIDFGDARFAKAFVEGASSEKVVITVADLDFSAGEAKILGSPGKIGKLFSVPTLTSNETVLRALIRNFRSLEQIGDANQLEYKLEVLRLAQVRRQLLGVGLNQASESRLVKVGFTSEQAQAVVARARSQPFVSRTELLSLDEVDLATYLRVRDRLTTRRSHLVGRVQHLIRWLLLGCLLRLSSYGTNVWLVFSVGGVAVTLFALMFWIVDRFRRLTPTPIVPTRTESLLMGVGGGGLLMASLGLIVQISDRPLATLITLALVCLPIPAVLILRLYQLGRYHDLMDRSYFVENGALRKLQVLIARLPVPPKFPFFRERYSPLLTDRRWNFLNYFDFSLNNWFKFGFNDIRLRDRCVPGLISALVWYQWSLGVIYITLLLWTLSRTIPGLNLLLYF